MLKFLAIFSPLYKKKTLPLRIPNSPLDVKAIMGHTKVKALMTHKLIRHAEFSFINISVKG